MEDVVVTRIGWYASFHIKCNYSMTWCQPKLRLTFLNLKNPSNGFFFIFFLQNLN